MFDASAPLPGGRYVDLFGSTSQWACSINATQLLLALKARYKTTYPLDVFTVLSLHSLWILHNLTKSSACYNMPLLCTAPSPVS